jgi:hypothetical protein
METITVKTWLPCFPGFYESQLFNYDMDAEAGELVVEQFTDKMFGFPRALLRAFLQQPDLPERWQLQLNFEGYKKAAAEEFCDQVEDLGFDIKVADWPVTRVQFESVVSPKEYNFKTDSVNCTITLIPEVVEDYIRLSAANFQKYLDERYTTRSGFISSYDPDPDFFLDRERWATDPHIMGALLDFMIKDQLGEDAESILAERVHCHTLLTDFYEFPEAVSDWLETEAAENIAAEYEKICSQCDEYVFVMGERYRARVAAHLESVVENLVKDMNESIEEFERGNGYAC